MIMDITFGKLAKIIIELKKEKLDKSDYFIIYEKEKTFMIVLNIVNSLPL